MSSPRCPAAHLDAVNDGAHRVDLLSDAYVVHDSALVDNPAAVLDHVERARDAHQRIAVDDVGTRPRTLSLLPLIEPDVIVLAPELAGAAPDTAAARALHVLAAQAERTGAVIVASGVDSERHRLRALALGATFGTGELFPPVGEESTLGGTTTMPTWSTPSTESKSPFAIASENQTTAISSKRLLVHLSMQVEADAADAGSDTLTLGTFQHARHFTPRTRRRWQRLAERTAYTGIYGVDMSRVSVPGILQSTLDPTDPLVDEWNVVVLGNFFCCVLSARDLHSGDPDPERRFEYVVSHDRGTVVRCARAVLSRFDGADAARPVAPLS